MTELGKGAKTLDALALAALPFHAQVCYLAARIVRERRPFALDDARPFVRQFFPRHGELERMAVALVEEVNRQRPLHNGRRAIALADELRNRPIGERLADPKKRLAAKIRFAQSNFGGFLDNSFSPDVLSMLALLKHEDRVYQVTWLDGGVRPVICALVKVVCVRERDPISGLAKEPFVESFLLYRVPGTGAAGAASVPDSITTLRDAWAYQVPKKVLALRRLGWSFVTNFEDQTLTATGPDESRVFPWQGSADHEEPGQA